MVNILCWNMQYKRASWDFMFEQHGDVDLALLQEACTPPDALAGKLDIGHGPWPRSCSDAVVGVSGKVAFERVSTPDVRASVAPTEICLPAVAIATTPQGERLGIASVEASHKTSPNLPSVMLHIQNHCGTNIPFIVGGDLTTWWDEKTTVFGDMMRIGLPLIGPHSATFYSPLHRQTPSDAELQLDYVFASRDIAHRVAVHALNNPDEWGPSDHCRVLIEVADT